MPQVCVIVPVRNGERYLRQCLESIRTQTLPDIEVIVIDDGSTDATPDIIAEFTTADPRFRVLPGPGQGSAGSARNAGLAEATGDYLSFLDADDFFAPTLLAQLHAKAVADDADVVASKFALYHEVTGEISTANWSLRLEYLPQKRPFAAEQVADQLFFAVNPAAWNKLFRRSFIQQAGLTFQPLPRINDARFTYLALARASRISYLDRALVTYRTGNEASLQGSYDESPLAFVEALDGIRAGLIEDGSFAVFERGFVNLALTMCLTNLRRPKTPEGFLAVYRAVQSDVLQRFGILDRPPGYFLRADLPEGLQRLTTLSPEAYLFHQARQAADDTARARAELRQTERQAGGWAAAAAWTKSVGRVRPASAPADGSSEEPVAVVRPGPDAADGAPDVSVIIPVHNTELFLAQCLDSALSQSGIGIEVICVDDGSDDGSGALLDDYAARDPRVQVVHQVNSGPSVARNVALDRATGRYLCFLDSDDYWRLDELSVLVAQMDAERLDLLLFDGVAIREDGVTDEVWQHYRSYYSRELPEGIRTGLDMVADLKQRHGYRASACLYLLRRDLVESSGLRFHPGITHEDDLFTFQLMLQVGRAAHTPTEFYGRRIRPGSIVTTAVRVASARGYLVNAVEMLRALHAHQIDDPRISTAFGDLAHRAFRAARDAAVELPEELVERLREVDPAPDAQALFLLLRLAWRDHRAARLQERRLKLAATGGPAWRRHPLVVKVKPHLKRLLGR